jgi:iron complex outermembrane receptor protein
MHKAFSIQSWLLGGAAVVALNATSASAQSTEAAPEQLQSETADIIVTAQFRSQNLQDTPLAISAVNAELMAARSQISIADVAKSSPSVAIEPSASGGGPASSNITIRGIGQTDSIGGVEPGVGVYIDDVYYGVLVGSVFELVDLDRVEILRGPQGTLAGKNSEGGSIRMFSKAPSNDLNGQMELTYGSFNRMQARGALNVPLIDDRLMLRVSGVFRKMDGFVDRLDYRCVNPGATNVPLASPGSVNNGCVIGEAGGQNLAAVRAALRAVISDGIENTITIDRQSDHREPDPVKLLYQSPLWAGANNFITGPKSYSNYATYIGYAGTANQYQGFVGNNADQWGISNKFEAKISDSLNLTSITAYRKTKAHGNMDGDASPFNVFMQDTQFTHKQFTQEVRLSGEVGRFADWTVGGYYYNADSLAFGHVDIPGGVVVGGGGVGLDFITRDPIKTKSKSTFAHGVIHLTNRLNLTGGIRYTDESKSYTFSRRASDGGPAPAAVAGLNGVSSTYSGNRWDWRVAVDYRWSNALLTYAQVATGFKGGGVNPRPYFPTQAVPFQPESVVSYEAGIKSDLFDRHLRLNVSAFYTDFSDMQLVVGSCDTLSPFPGAPCSQTTNAGDSKLWGVEVEATIRPVDGMTIDLSGSFLDFKYKAVNPLTGIVPGSDLPFLAKNKVSAGVQYEVPAFGGTLTPRLDVDYRSGFETEPVNGAIAYATRVNARTLANARLTYKMDGGDWELSAAVTNLFDRYYIANKFDRTTPPFFLAQGIIGRPREWSVSIKRNF